MKKITPPVKLKLLCGDLPDWLWDAIHDEFHRQFGDDFLELLRTSDTWLEIIMSVSDDGGAELSEIPPNDAGAPPVTYPLGCGSILAPEVQRENERRINQE